jgi:AcrR family transcriptional regulator
VRRIASGGSRDEALAKSEEVGMASPEVPLTRDRIVATAEDVLRRFGPEKATVVDVARALGVSHAAVYRHVKTKAELRDLVVQRWINETMSPLRTIVARPGPAPKRLRQLFDTLISTKRRRAAADPEVFTAYRSLSAESQSVVAAHLDELVRLGAAIIRSGVEEGTFRRVDPVPASQAILFATSRFHHPAHAMEWTNPKLDKVYNDVWWILMEGLGVERKGSGAQEKTSV